MFRSKKIKCITVCKSKETFGWNLNNVLEKQSQIAQHSMVKDLKLDMMIIMMMAEFLTEIINYQWPARLGK